jgi:hypothetical protein
MTTQTAPLIAELNSHCTCTKVDDEGNEVLDKYGEPEPSENCFGDCWEYAVEDLYESLVKDWLATKGLTAEDTLRVDGSSMGWRHQSGWTTVKAGHLHEALTLNGDFRLRFTLEDGELYAVRYSHDEPVGTGRFTFSLASEEDLEY